jgi:hypothetical protein
MWVFIIGFLITLWGIGLLIWLLYKWIPPDEGVYHQPRGPATKA